VQASRRERACPLEQLARALLPLRHVHNQPEGGDALPVPHIPLRMGSIRATSVRSCPSTGEARFVYGMATGVAGQVVRTGFSDYTRIGAVTSLATIGAELFAVCLRVATCYGEGEVSIRIGKVRRAWCMTPRQVFGSNNVQCHV
jgi:hypothetical protein